MRRNLAPRAPTRAHASARALLHQSTLLLSLSLLIHSNSTLSLPKPWRSSTTLSSTIEAPPPRRSIAGGRRRSTPTSYTTSTSSSFLELGASPSFSLQSLPLPQASSKENELELHQALYLILKPLPVFQPSPVSSSPPRSIPIALGCKP